MKVREVTIVRVPLLPSGELWVASFYLVGRSKTYPYQDKYRHVLGPSRWLTLAYLKAWTRAITMRVRFQLVGNV